MRTSIAQVGTVRVGVQRSPNRQTGRFSTKYVRAANITTHGIDVSDLLDMDFTPRERQIYALRDGDVLLTEASGSAAQVGRAAIWREGIPGICFQNTVIRFRPRATLPEFAHIVFRHYAAQGVFAQTARGVGIQHLGGARFAALPFPLPPIEEQKRIADETERRTAALRVAESSLRSAIGRIQDQTRLIIGSAVTGDLVDQEIVLAEREGRTFRSARDVLQEFIQPGVETQETLPTPADSDSTSSKNLPAGWIWARLKDLGEIRLGKQLTPEEEHGANQHFYLRVANVLEDAIEIHDLKKMHFSEAEHDLYRLKRGDILLNEGQSIELVGRPAMFRDEVPDICFQNHLIRFRSGPAIVPEYALLVFRHYLHTGEFRRIARRSTNIAHLGLERFSGLLVALPPPDEQRRIVNEAQSRLEASRVQGEAVSAALRRVPEMERELLVAAIGGSLVPQDPDAESGAALLERIGKNNEETSTINDDGVRIMKAAKKKDQVHRHSTETIQKVLKDAGRPIRVPELFSLLDYDRNSAEDVESFYLKLRAEFARTIRVVGEQGENAMLEAIPDAPQ
jgi:type I restriction enzyme S subunit